MQFRAILGMLNNRARSIGVLTHVWLLLFIYTYPRAIQAATFAEDMRDYDYESILWAIATGLLGGFARTLVSLASDKVIVSNVWREAAKDAVVSIIAGGAALVFLEALRSVYWQSMPSAVRFAIILFAGASRVSFFGYLNKFITQVMDAWTARIAGKFAQEKLTADDNTPITTSQKAQMVISALRDRNMDVDPQPNTIPVSTTLATKVKNAAAAANAATEDPVEEPLIPPSAVLPVDPKPSGTP
jgi:hypothetical protein